MTKNERPEPLQFRFIYSASFYNLSRSIECIRGMYIVGFKRISLFTQTLIITQSRQTVAIENILFVNYYNVDFNIVRTFIDISKIVVFKKFYIYILYIYIYIYVTLQPMKIISVIQHFISSKLNCNHDNNQNQMRVSVRKEIIHVIN